MKHQQRWTIQKITKYLDLIKPLVYRQRRELSVFKYRELTDADRTPVFDLITDEIDWIDVLPETYWGTWSTNFVLRSTFQVPPEWSLTEPIALSLPLGESGDFSHPEALVYIDGVPIAACDRQHHEIILPPSLIDHNVHTLVLHGWTGIGGQFAPTNEHMKLFMGRCAVVQIDQHTREFVATTRVALEAARHLEDQNPVKGSLLNALDSAFQVLDLREPFGKNFYASVPSADQTLCEGIRRAGSPLDVEITATGHGHIDIGWLWNVQQGRQKASRTFHTVIHLMEQFPEYHFTQSQPQLYEFIRQDHPALFAKIQQKAAEGQWEVTGGMWVEADCNLSGAEALARQFLLGTEFFREHFAADQISPILWLPDVFGYSANLPQLIKQAGLEYFFTIKIGWNQYNRIPFDSFWWQGLDGTRVLTHFSSTPEPGSIENKGTYNAVAAPEAVLGSWLKVQDKDIQRQILMSYGWGDGGGGPTSEMIENIREMSVFPALPMVHQGSAIDFFRNLERDSGAQLPTWVGELYLELHRGTYTTQSRTKRANRKTEFLLHDAEFLACVATLLDQDYVYPAEALREAWRNLCLNQFHDILPGSSIKDVYVEALARYEGAMQKAQGISDSALSIIMREFGGDLLIINPTGFARSDLAFWRNAIPADHMLCFLDGRPIAVQAASDGVWLDVGQIPPYSITSLALRTIEPLPAPQQIGLHASPTLLENSFLRIKLDSSGDITSIYDKEFKREILLSGAIANQMQAFEDRPLHHDAWDIDIFYEDKHWLSEPASRIQVIENGPLRATIEIQRQILHSVYTQRISLSYNSRRIDFHTQIDWHERHILLKTAFPIDILTSVATYEIQWGNVQRPTHRNTSWDWARFETCAHKWIDVSEGNYGVSLLNDCKYGHDVQGGVMRLSLLRSPTRPDPDADQGQHTFTYALLPHIGSWDETTVNAAYALNDPLLTVAGSGQPPRHEVLSFVSTDSPNIVIETVKQSEDGKGFVVRLYESQRSRKLVTLKFERSLIEAWRCNLLEEDRVPLEINGNAVSILIKPFEIVTLCLRI